MSKLIATDLTFEELFKQYFNPLVNFVNSHIRNIEDSREIVQNTFLKIWQNKDELQIKTSVKAYLYQMTKNGMIDHIRLSKKDINLKETLLKNQLNEKNNNQLDPFIIRGEIIKSMDGFKPKMKEIFTLSKFEGLSHKEIAAHMDISVRSVEDNLSRAITKLREDLSQNKILFD